MKQKYHSLAFPHSSKNSKRKKRTHLTYLHFCGNFFIQIIDTVMFVCYVSSRKATQFKANRYLINFTSSDYLKSSLFVSINIVNWSYHPEKSVHTLDWFESYNSWIGLECKTYKKKKQWFLFQYNCSHSLQTLILSIHFKDVWECRKILKLSLQFLKYNTIEL